MGIADAQDWQEAQGPGRQIHPSKSALDEASSFSGTVKT
jgi:hypothetical protein